MTKKIMGIIAAGCFLTGCHPGDSRENGSDTSEASRSSARSSMNVEHPSEGGSSASGGSTAAQANSGASNPSNNAPAASGTAKTPPGATHP
jgi:hypothetical protein